METSQKPEGKFVWEQTPETYLGYECQNEYHGKESITQDKPSHYSYSLTLPQNTWTLQGEWQISAQKITNTNYNASIQLHFVAGKVFAVMGAENNQPIHVKVLLNGVPVKDNAGKDVKNGILVVTRHDLYSILDLKKETNGIIELIVLDPGLEIYTFTFGGV